MSRGRAALWAASRLIALYIRFVAATCRWTYIGEEQWRALDDGDGKIILAFWHERLLMVPILRRRTKRRVLMLISAHRDGQIIADAVGGFGIEFIRGSAANPKKAFKRKSGAAALTQMIAALDDGAIVGVTPDGPRGPARRAQAGVARLAALAGATVVPIAYATAAGRGLKTWDSFFLPRPFTRGAFVAGAPVTPAGSSAEALDAATCALEQALDDAAARADAFVGRDRATERVAALTGEAPAGEPCER